MQRNGYVVLLIECILLGALIALWVVPYIPASRSGEPRKSSPWLKILHWIVVLAAFALAATYLGWEMSDLLRFAAILACFVAVVLFWRLLYYLAKRASVNLRPLVPWLVGVRYTIALLSAVLLLLRLPQLSSLTGYLLAAFGIAWSLSYLEDWISESAEKTA